MPSNEEHRDPENALERMEDLGRRLFRVTKDKIQELEHEAEKSSETRSAPPPEGGAAVAEED